MMKNKKTNEIIKLFLNKSRKQILIDFGLCYNDVNEKIWMYRLPKSKQVFWRSYKFVYIIFNDDYLVDKVILRKSRIKNFIHSISLNSNNGLFFSKKKIATF